MVHLTAQQVQLIGNIKIILKMMWILQKNQYDKGNIFSIVN